MLEVMNTTLPETVDVWRMVTARRTFQGLLPQASLHRLIRSLAASEALVVYTLEFGKDEFGIAYLNVHVETPLTLICQRTLEPFALPIHVDTRLGLISHEQEEAALPAGYEALLVENGQLHLADVIEDELILALPIIPVDPASEESEPTWSDKQFQNETEEKPRKNPFAILAKLKKAEG